MLQVRLVTSPASGVTGTHVSAHPRDASRTPICLLPRTVVVETEGIYAFVQNVDQLGPGAFLSIISGDYHVRRPTSTVVLR